MGLSNTVHRFSGLFASSLLLLGLAGIARAQGNSNQNVRVLVQKTKRADAQAVSKAISTHGATVHGQIPAIDTLVLSVPQAALKGIMRSLGDTGLFTFVEEDSVGKAASIPNDPGFGSQWHLNAINAPAAWDITTGKTTVPIAMVDSGVNPGHPDLAGKLIPGWSFLLANNNTADVQGHGTATAGVAAAAGNNGVGVTGVSWQSPIMPLVVLNSADSAYYSDIANAITYAADHGARVINVSIGGSASSSTLQSAVNYAWNKGSVVFASAMNNGTSAPYYPAACDNVIAVSATEPGDTLSGFSNFGSWIDLAAPGNNIYTTDNAGGYSTWYGTSFSSPIVAATAALALSINPGLTAQGLVNVLEKNSDDIGAPGFDTSFGWGRINAYRVALAAQSSVSVDSVPPSIAITSPIGGGMVSGNVQIQGSATDNIGVTRVELWIDGQLNSTCSSVAYSCTWNSGSVAAGGHSVIVKAYDAAGNSGSASESLNVAAPVGPDSQAPVVQITNPQSGATVSGVVNISAKGSDNVAVTQVSIFIDGVQKSTTTATTNSYSWNTKKLPAGSHTITAKAWDAAGNVGSATSTVMTK